MRTNYTLLLTFCLGLSIFKSAAVTVVYDNFSVVIPAFAYIKATTTPSAVSMTLTTPSAGAKTSTSTNSNLYLKVTSIVLPGKSRRITAKVSNSSIPTGTLLKVVSNDCSYPTTQGNFGNAVLSGVTLMKDVDQIIVDGIGSCYTGAATTDGYNLTFTWQPDDSYYYRLLSTGPGTGYMVNLTVTFTLSDNP